MSEDDMVGWHHQLNGHEFEQAPGDGEGREAWHAAVHRVAKTYNIAHKIQRAKEIHPCSKRHPFTMLYYSIQGLAIEIQREKI